MLGALPLILLEWLQVLHGRATEFAALQNSSESVVTLNGTVNAGGIFDDVFAVV